MTRCACLFYLKTDQKNKKKMEDTIEVIVASEKHLSYVENNSRYNRESSKKSEVPESQNGHRNT